MTSMNPTKLKESEIGTIPEEWDVFDIQSVSDVVGGGTPSTTNENNFNGEIPWITPRDLSTFQDRFISHGERYISLEGLNSSNAKLLPPNTVLLTTRAPVGYLAIAKNEVTTNQGFHSLIPNDKTDSLFLFYLLKNNVQKLVDHASGSTFQELNGKTLKSLKFPFPKINEQKLISEILSSLDEKIELNRKINTNLENLASSLFKKWFIDIGDELPAGWRTGRLGEEFKIIMGQSPSGNTYNENGQGLPFYQGRSDFGFRFPSRRIYCTEPKRKARSLDTLVSVRAPVGDVNMAFEECCIGRGVSSIRKEDFPSYTYYMIKSLQKKISKFDSEGTVFGSINKNSLADIPCVIPPQKMIIEFERIISEIDEQIMNLSRELENLKVIQDSLLPRLMSGRIRI